MCKKQPSKINEDALGYSCIERDLNRCGDFDERKGIVKMQAKKITVTGLVQGVGFRPAVAELAEECKLAGQVKNMGGVVEIFASGENEAVEKFLHRLSLLPVGRIDSLKVQDVPYDAACTSTKMGSCAQIDSPVQKQFVIVESSNGREEVRLLPVDFPTCDRCREELFDKKNRRYRYPFISCTQCGPRYSIQREVPYDRDSITMGDFEMCPECLNEYTKKGNIRRHAQTIACHTCGPTLKLVSVGSAGKFVILEKDTEAILTQTVKALKEEKIVAIKDIGGFHFAFSPMSSTAAKRLREFKHRDKKPFAVMFPGIEAIREFCEVSSKEEELLTSNARPIVLLKKKKDFVTEICGESDRMGAFLPCNPLQILLIEETGPLVMTSGNRGGEPIITNEEEMKKLMEEGCPDFMLTHDREILTPLDDSIYQVNGSFVQLLRRARGLVPEPIELAHSLNADTFAAGGDLKAVFALGRGKMVYLSQYFGDLEEVRCMKQRSNAITRMKELLALTPEVSVGDLHPAYVSAKDTNIKIQHHMAHVVSVIAEHHLEGKVLGIACDGTGYGTDGTIWGSEFFTYDNGKMERVGHFGMVRLLGGDAGAKDADKTLFSYRMEARERGLFIGDETCRDIEMGISGETERLQEMAWKQNINTALSSSMGRLFDAASALLEICHYNSYEGECAILLEQAAHKGKEKFFQLQEGGREKLLTADVTKQDGMWIADGVKLLADLSELKRQYENQKEVLAYLFHHAIAKAIVTMAESAGKEYNKVVLSGGSFLNRILLNEVAEGLHAAGKEVYTNEKVPCGDGGIALGQIFCSIRKEYRYVCSITGKSSKDK